MCGVIVLYHTSTHVSIAISLPLPLPLPKNIAYQTLPNLHQQGADTVAKFITERQVGRRKVVGSNPGTYATIEKSFLSFVRAWEVGVEGGSLVLSYLYDVM